MKKISIIVILTLISGFEILAQEVGVIIGYSSSTITVDTKFEKELEFSPGVNLSILFNKEIAPQIYFRPGFGLSQKGYYDKIFKIRYNFYYLQGDFDFTYLFDEIPIYIEAGMFSSFAAAGTYIFRDETYNLEFGKNHTNPFDLGISIGAGYIYQIDDLKIFGELKYEIGFVNLYPHYNNFYQNNTLKLNLGIMFGL